MSLKRKFLTSMVAGFVTLVSASALSAGWQAANKTQLGRVLAATNEENQTLASRVNGVQVIAIDRNAPSTLVMVGRLAAWKDKDQRWALSSGKPKDSEVKAGAFEAGAYRELREEFGILESWGQKTSSVLINDAGKFGVKLVFFFELDRSLFTLANMNEVITNELTVSDQSAPEYVEWMFMPLATFREELTSATPTLSWRKFDKNMFGSKDVLDLVEKAIQHR